MHITKDIIYIGVNDYQLDFFEGQYIAPKGMAYNSYLIIDEKTAVIDSVDGNFTQQWLDNIAKALDGKVVDYLVVQHMEPDHSAGILDFVQAYPHAKIVASCKAFAMMKNFFCTDFAEKQVVVCEGGELSLGKHKLNFITAPMVHWPEVIMTYDSTDKVLFSADAFGKFGAFDADEGWTDEARRYYIGIVSKYGSQVQAVLRKIAKMDIEKICSLHGSVIGENIPYYLERYNMWSGYQPEEDGVIIAYTSIYGNTKKAVLQLAEELRVNGCPKVALIDIARSDWSCAVAEAFRYDKLVLATTTYNADIFPAMRQFIDHLVERNFSNHTIAFVENGSWAPVAAKAMKAMIEKNRENTFAENSVKIVSALNEESTAQIKALAQELCADYEKRK